MEWWCITADKNHNANIWGLVMSYIAICKSDGHSHLHATTEESSVIE